MISMNQNSEIIRRQLGAGERVIWSLNEALYSFTPFSIVAHSGIGRQNAPNGRAGLVRPRAFIFEKR